MANRVTQNRKVRQITVTMPDSTLDASVRMALKSLQVQINTLRNKLMLVDGESETTDPTGTPDAIAPAPVLELLTNKSGAARNLGDVVVYNTANAESFTTTTTVGNEGVIGVVASDSTDGVADAIAINADGYVCVSGKAVCRVNAAVAIAVGDYLVAYSVAGYAAKAASPFMPGIFARALEAKASGTGLIEVCINPAIEIRNLPALQPNDERVGYDTDGSITGFSGFVNSATWWRTSAMSQYIEHELYFYSADGNVCSGTLSFFDVAGAGISSLHYTLEYSAGNMTRILQEIA